MQRTLCTPSAGLAANEPGLDDTLVRQSSMYGKLDCHKLYILWEVRLLNLIQCFTSRAAWCDKLPRDMPITLAVCFSRNALRASCPSEGCSW